MKSSNVKQKRERERERGNLLIAKYRLMTRRMNERMKKRLRLVVSIEKELELPSSLFAQKKF